MLENTNTNLGQVCRKRHTLQVVTRIKCRITKSSQIFGQLNADQTIAIKKRLCFDFRNGIGKLNARQGTAIGKCVFANFGDRCGNVNFFQVGTIVKRFLADNLQSIGKRYLFERVAILKGQQQFGHRIPAHTCGYRYLGGITTVSNRDRFAIFDEVGHAVNQISVRRSATVIDRARQTVLRAKGVRVRALVNHQHRHCREGIDAHGGHALGNQQTRQLLTTEERIGSNRLQALGKIDLCQIFTFVERVARDRGHACGNRDRGQAVTIRKRVRAHACQRARKLHLGQCRTAVERKAVHHHKTFGQINCGNLGAARKSAIADLGHRGRNIDARQLICHVERIIADDLQALGKRHLCHLVAILKGLTQLDHGIPLDGCGNGYLGQRIVAIHGDRLIILDHVGHAIHHVRTGKADTVVHRVGKIFFYRKGIRIRIRVHGKQRACGEGVVIHLGHAAGNDQTSKTCASEKCVRADGRHRLGKHHAEQILALIERVARNRGHALGNRNNRKSIAVSKRVRADGCQRGRQRNARNRITSVERQSSERRQALGEIDRAELGAARKRILTDLGNRGRNIHGLQLGCHIEAVASDLQKRIGQRHVDDCLVILEGLAQLGYGIAVHRCGNRHLGDVSLAADRDRLAVLDVVADTVDHNRIGRCRGIDDLTGNAVCHRIVVCRAVLVAPNGQLGAIFKRVDANLGKAVGQNDRIELIAAIECLVTNGGQGLVGHDANQRVRVGKGLLANLGNALCQRHAVERVIVSKQAIAQLDNLFYLSVHGHRGGDVNVRSTAVIRGQHHTCFVSLGFP